MLDGLLNRGFAAKCKSLIKLTKSRIEVIRRKRNATLKFLKKDVADLLANGLDINAYGRAEGLLAELTLSSCYDFVEQSCDFVSKHLSVMQKLRHCPEDCREAVASIMFAAARFSDLPELRDLRQFFYERYGNAVELFVNQEFVEKISSKPFTKEKKIKIMQDIAAEFSIKWDSRTCEQIASKSPSLAQEQPKVYRFSQVNRDENKSTNGRDTIPQGDEYGVSSKERLAHVNVYNSPDDKWKDVTKRNDLHQSRHDGHPNRYELHNDREETNSKKDNCDYIPQRRHEAAAMDKHEPWKEDTVDTPMKAVRLGSSSRGKRTESVGSGSKQQHHGGENPSPKKDFQHTSESEKFGYAPGGTLWSNNDYKESMLGKTSYGGQHNTVNSARDVQGKEINELKPYYNNVIPPPYTKPSAKLKDGSTGANLWSSHLGSEINVVPKDPSSDNRSDAGNRAEKNQQRAYNLDHEKQIVEGHIVNGLGHHNNNYHDAGISNNPIPKPRSSRRRHAKSHSSRDDVGNIEDTGVVKRRPRSRRRDDSRRGLQILFDDEHNQNDEEERMIDKLLLHYSKKPSSVSEPGKVRRKSKSHHAHHHSPEVEKSPKLISRDQPEELAEVVPPPRSISLPREQTAPSEGTKVYARAASFQPDRSSAARHVHPKLPDYDDLAARFAALKGR